MKWAISAFEQFMETKSPTEKSQETMNPAEETLGDEQKVLGEGASFSCALAVSRFPITFATDLASSLQESLGLLLELWRALKSPLRTEMFSQPREIPSRLRIALKEFCKNFASDLAASLKDSLLSFPYCLYAIPNNVLMGLWSKISSGKSGAAEMGEERMAENVPQVERKAVTERSSFPSKVAEARERKEATSLKATSARSATEHILKEKKVTEEEVIVSKTALHTETSKELSSVEKVKSVIQFPLTFGTDVKAALTEALECFRHYLTSLPPTVLNSLKGNLQGGTNELSEERLRKGIPEFLATFCSDFFSALSEALHFLLYLFVHPLPGRLASAVASRVSEDQELSGALAAVGRGASVVAGAGIKATSAILSFLLSTIFSGGKKAEEGSPRQEQIPQQVGKVEMSDKEIQSIETVAEKHEVAVGGEETIDFDMMQAKEEQQKLEIKSHTMKSTDVQSLEVDEGDEQCSLRHPKPPFSEVPITATRDQVGVAREGVEEEAFFVDEEEGHYISKAEKKAATYKDFSAQFESPDARSSEIKEVIPVEEEKYLSTMDRAPPPPPAPTEKPAPMSEASTQYEEVAPWYNDSYRPHSSQQKMEDKKEKVENEPEPVPEAVPRRRKKSQIDTETKSTGCQIKLDDEAKEIPVAPPPPTPPIPVETEEICTQTDLVETLEPYSSEPAEIERREPPFPRSAKDVDDEVEARVAARTRALKEDMILRKLAERIQNPDLYDDDEEDDILKDELFQDDGFLRKVNEKFNLSSEAAATKAPEEDDLFTSSEPFPTDEDFYQHQQQPSARSSLFLDVSDGSDMELGRSASTDAANLQLHRVHYEDDIEELSFEDDEEDVTDAAAAKTEVAEGGKETDNFSPGITEDTDETKNSISEERAEGAGRGRPLKRGGRKSPTKARAAVKPGLEVAVKIDKVKNVAAEEIPVEHQDESPAPVQTSSGRLARPRSRVSVTRSPSSIEISIPLNIEPAAEEAVGGAGSAAGGAFALQKSPSWDNFSRAVREAAVTFETKLAELCRKFGDEEDLDFGSIESDLLMLGMESGSLASWGDSESGGGAGVGEQRYGAISTMSEMVPESRSVQRWQILNFISC